MRVNQTNQNQVQGTETKRTGKAGAAQEGRATDRSQRGESAGSTDSVKSDISTRGKDIAKAKAAATSAPDVRDEKIAELKRRIAEGSYKVDANAVADRMVNEHLADLG